MKYNIPTDSDWIIKVLYWLNKNYSYFSYFSNSNIDYPSGTFNNLIYAGHKSISFYEWENFRDKSDLVGLISYDYKNKIENLSSQNKNLISSDYQDNIFFIPEFILTIKEHSFEVVCDFEINFDAIFSNTKVNFENPSVNICSLSTKEEYVQNVNKIRNHIEEGDIYELNYCQAFSFKESDWDPIIAFFELKKLSPMPFSGLLKIENQFLLCASPERFLKKIGDQLIAQPIKGTIKRGSNIEEDNFYKEKLKSSEKERAENLMIVDLMRNDLSKISKPGTVQVAELFGIYGFTNVFQMISSINAEINDYTSFKDIIGSTFPMGSMTGAPKIKSMELIEKYENFKRGWFSGSLGYLSKNGDFDFNVIIRSLIFNKDTGEGFFAVGSAITFDSDPLMEYEECFLKASALIQLLTKNT